MNKDLKSKDYISTAELAEILGISRMHALRKIKSGEIKAERIGRGFVIRKKDILEIAGHILGEDRKKELESAISKTLDTYGEAIKKLGQE